MRKLIVFVLLLFASVAFCEDNVVVVDLIPNVEKATLKKPEASSSGKYTSVSCSSSERNTPGSSAGKIKLGNYAIVIAEVGYIYSKPNLSSKVLGAISYQDVVIVKKQSGNFYGILLEDGTTVGWVYGAYLTKYDVEVWANSKKKNEITGYSKGKISNSSLVEFAKQYSRTPYVYGGTSITRGMDCSAFVRDVFKRFYGRELPRTARQQATQGVDVPINQLLMKEGDRLYFKYKNSYIDHTGIYVGNGYYIHCDTAKHGVSIDYLWNKRPYSKLVSVKRFQ